MRRFLPTKRCLSPTMFHILGLANGVFFFEKTKQLPFLRTEATKSCDVSVKPSMNFAHMEVPGLLYQYVLLCLVIFFSKELTPQDERKSLHRIRVSAASMCCEPRPMDLGGSAGPCMRDTAEVVGGPGPTEHGRGTEHGKEFRAGVGTSGWGGIWKTARLCQFLGVCGI